MRVRLRMINTALLQLVAAFLTGVLLSLIIKIPALPLEQVDGVSMTANPVPLFWFPLCAFIMGTSTIGYKLVPLLMALRGYLLTASVSILLRSGLNSESTFFMVAIPAVFSVPAFFLICEDAVSSSRILCLCSESGLMRSCRYIQPLRLLCSVLLLLTAAAAQIYLIPQIV